MCCKRVTVQAVEDKTSEDSGIKSQFSNKAKAFDTRIP